MNAIQLDLFENEIETWDTDSYETPDSEAFKIASLLRPSEPSIIEPFAGTGQIAKYLPPATCIEVKGTRYRRGASSLPHHNWIFGDTFEVVDQITERFDVAITNPPFSVALEAIALGLSLVKPSGRLLYLLPIDTFCKVGMNKELLDLDCSITEVIPFVNRIAYLKDGIPQRGRQIYDAVFEIKPGRGKGMRFL